MVPDPSTFAVFLCVMTLATSAFTVQFNITGVSALDAVHVVGSIPELGQWAEENAVRLVHDELLNQAVCQVSIHSPIPALKYRFQILTSTGMLHKDIRRIVKFPNELQAAVANHPAARFLIRIDTVWGIPESRVSVFVPGESIYGSTSLDRLRPQLKSVLAGIHQLRDEKNALAADIRAMVASVFDRSGLASTLGDKISQLHHNRVIKRLLTEINELKGKVKVVTRFRPLIEGEHEAFPFVIPNSTTVIVRGDDQVNDPSGPYSSQPHPDRQFHFDEIFEASTDNVSFYERSRIKTVIESSVLIANNVCIFSYGQTNSGKSHTVLGSRGEAGIVELALDSVFAVIEAAAQTESRIVEVEMVEIYRESVFELIPNGTRIYSKSDIMHVFEERIAERATATTRMNSASSRSHCVFTLTLTDAVSGQVCKIFLVDLAGSERTKVSGAEGDRLAEANSINKSLSTLGLVLNGLLNKRPFIPYRDSKLTKLLAPVFAITNPPSKVVMIANVSPFILDAKETLSTLSFAQRVGQIELRESLSDVSDELNHKMEKLRNATTHGSVVSPDKGDNTGRSARSGSAMSGRRNSVSSVRTASRRWWWLFAHVLAHILWVVQLSRSDGTQEADGPGRVVSADIHASSALGLLRLVSVCVW